MSMTVKRKDTLFWINTFITIALMIVVGYLPPFGAITPLGMKVLGVFLGMLYGWITIEMIWPSIIGLVFFGLSGFTTVSAAFGTCMDSNVMMTFMAFLMAGLFNSFGVTDYIIGKVMSVKALIGHPWRMALAIFLADAFLSIFAAGVAGMIMLWAIIDKIAEKVGCEKDDRFIRWLIAGTVIANFLPNMIAPFQATVIVYMSFITSVMNLEIPFIPYIVWMTMFNVIVFILYFAFGKYVLKCDTSKFETDEDHFAYMRGQQITRIQKIGLCLITVFVFILMFPIFAPAEWGITQVFKNLGIIGAIAILITIGAIIKDDKGNAVAPIGKLMHGVGWDIVWLLAATFPVAAAMRSADCGIMMTVNMFVRPLAEGMGPYALTILFMVILGVVTQVTHNVVLGAMFMPFICPLVAEMGGNPIVAWIALFVAMQSAYATPAASMCAAFIFGNNHFKDSKDGYYFGTMIFIFMLVTGVALIPLGIWLF